MQLEPYLIDTARYFLSITYAPLGLRYELPGSGVVPQTPIIFFREDLGGLTEHRPFNFRLDHLRRKQVGRASARFLVRAVYIRVFPPGFVYGWLYQDLLLLSCLYLNIINT